jgi:hypothetical protein
MCNAPKYGEVEERTGYGGGYNDRGVVEYIERQDSDDEYDEVISARQMDVCVQMGVCAQMGVCVQMGVLCQNISCLLYCSVSKYETQSVSKSTERRMPSRLFGP